MLKITMKRDVDMIISYLRMVPTIVIAHTFCASPDTRNFLLAVLSNAGIVLHDLKLCGESRT